ncbi:MAG: MCE family protein [Deltaproteobacteria bacterium]|nr:MCE family protein [Deltaproteobacteria bacterium]
MARKTSKFVVGLFVIVGFLIAAVAIIWIGATKYFEKGKLYVTYFDESVQGLQKDSEVKYRGVTIGRVENIRIAPDNRLIAVVMNIRLRDETVKQLVAQLQYTGITGLVFVNLDIRRPEDLEQAPLIDFASEYPVIPSKPSEIKRLLSSAQEIVNKIKELDLKGISEQIQATLKAIGKFAGSRELKQIMANMKDASASLKNLTAQLDRQVTEGQVSQALADAGAALTEARDLFANLNRELKALKLPEISGRTRSLLAEVEETTAKLKAATENVEQLAERLRRRPSDLLFGKPPQPRWNER